MNIYELESVENEIIDYLDNNKKVYIESGAANDSIDSYRINKYKNHSWQTYEEREVIFETSACIFSKEIILSNWDNAETEIYKDCLFVKVW